MEYLCRCRHWALILRGSDLYRSMSSTGTFLESGYDAMCALPTGCFVDFRNNYNSHSYPKQDSVRNDYINSGIR